MVVLEIAPGNTPLSRLSCLKDLGPEINPIPKEEDLLLRLQKLKRFATKGLKGKVDILTWTWACPWACPWDPLGMPMGMPMHCRLLCLPDFTRKKERKQDRKKESNAERKIELK